MVLFFKCECNYWLAYGSGGIARPRSALCTGTPSSFGYPDTFRSALSENSFKLNNIKPASITKVRMHWESAYTKTKLYVRLVKLFFQGKIVSIYTEETISKNTSNAWTQFSLILKQSRDRKIYPSYPHALPWTLTLNLLSVHTFSKSVSIWTLALWQLSEARHHRAHPGLTGNIPLLSPVFYIWVRAEGGRAYTFPRHTSTMSTLYSFGLLLSQNLFSEHSALSLCALRI